MHLPVHIALNMVHDLINVMNFESGVRNRLICVYTEPKCISFCISVCNVSRFTLLTTFARI